jgi:hypothetical protein
MNGQKLNTSAYYKMNAYAQGTCAWSGYQTMNRNMMLSKFHRYSESGEVT